MIYFRILNQIKDMDKNGVDDSWHGLRANFPILCREMWPNLPVREERICMKLRAIYICNHKKDGQTNKLA